MVTDTAKPDDKLTRWTQRFLDDLAVVRSANTVRAYTADVRRWIAFCQTMDTDPFAVRPRLAIEFIRQESERACGKDRTVSTRSIVRRLSAIRQWYAYLALEPESTGVDHNPIPAGTAARAGAGVIAGKPALLRYDRPLPEALPADEIDRFLACLTATRYRDRAIAWLLKDGGLRISEALTLRLNDINWSKRLLTVRASKNGTNRVVPISQDAITIVADYVRLERPMPLSHDAVFVNLGRRGFGQPFTYRSWVAVCAKAREEAETPGIHAHAFRHTYATNMAEAGMPPGTPWVTLKRVLGHQHLDTLAIYNHVRDSRVQREYQDAMKAAETARSDGRRS